MIFACSALSRPVRIAVGVLRRVCMPVAALRRSFHACQAPSHVDPAGHRLKVLHVDTLSYSAQMVKVQPLRNRTDRIYVGPTVCVDFFPLYLECSVA